MNGARTRARNSYNKSGLNLSTPFLVGAAVGLVLPPQSSIVNNGAIMMASAPIKGMGQAKGFAQGYVFMEAFQAVTGFMQGGLLSGIGVGNQNVGPLVI